MESERLALEMRNITKTFPGVRALDDVSFDCVRGEVHALCGENGAGKSTLIKILGGAYQPDAGSIQLDGRDVVFSHTGRGQRPGSASFTKRLQPSPLSYSSRKRLSRH